jgi:site-specific DNA-cytosine methylase
MAEHTATELIEWWNDTFGLELQLVHRFGCELHPLKRAFSNKQFGFHYMFANARDLSNVRAYDTLSKSYVTVPTCHVFIGGFSCKANSRANNSRPKDVRALADSDTGETLQYTKDYIVQRKPLTFILENVVEILIGGPQSDCASITEDLSFWYQIDVFEMIAEEFGSRAGRRRIYIVGHLREDVNLTVARMRTLRPSVLAMKLKPECRNTKLPYTLFLDESLEDADTRMLEGLLDEGFNEGIIFPVEKKEEAEYKFDHLEAYSTIGEVWPPSDARLKQVFKKQDAPLLSVISRRGLECLFWGIVKHPSIREGCHIEWMDWNFSLPRLAGAAFTRNPWEADVTGTVMTTTRLLLRVRKESESRGFDLYSCTGMEAMQLMGYDRRSMKDPYAASDDLFRDMAGNAFSAFSCGPILASSIPMSFMSRSDLRLDGQAVLELSDSEAEADMDDDSGSSPESSSSD